MAASLRTRSTPNTMWSELTSIALAEYGAVSAQTAQALAVRAWEVFVDLGGGHHWCGWTGYPGGQASRNRLRGGGSGPPAMWRSWR